MSLDLAFPARRLTAPAAIELAITAEGRGWAGVWSPEVLGLDALVMSGVLASVTPRLRVGTTIVPITTRSVAVLGMAASTIAQLGPGRFHLGLGVSTPTIVDARHDRPAEPPLAVARGALETLQAILRGRTVSRDAHPAVTDLRIDAPTEPPPLLLAALGPRMLNLAYEVADGVILNLLPLEAVREHVDRAPVPARDGFEKVLLTRVCVDPTDEDRRKLTREVASYCRVDVYARNFERSGYDLEGVRAAGTLDDAVDRLPDGLVDEVVITGAADYCRERLARLASLGVSPLVMAAGSDDSVTRILQRLDPTPL